MAGTAIEVFSHSKTEGNDSDSIQQDWEDASQHLHDNEDHLRVLRNQSQHSQEDLKILKRLKEEALSDPVAYINFIACSQTSDSVPPPSPTCINKKCFSRAPKLQKLCFIPPINLDKYEISSRITPLSRCSSLEMRSVYQQLLNERPHSQISCSEHSNLSFVAIEARERLKKYKKNSTSSTSPSALTAAPSFFPSPPTSTTTEISQSFIKAPLTTHQRDFNFEPPKPPTSIHFTKTRVSGSFYTNRAQPTSLAMPDSDDENLSHLSQQKCHRRRPSPSTTSDSFDLSSIPSTQHDTAEFKELCDLLAKKRRLHEVKKVSDSVHLGYQCDCCGKEPIVGTRWTCQVCPEVDLCATCASSRYENPPHLTQHQLTRTELADAPYWDGTNSVDAFNYLDPKFVVLS